MQKKVSAIAKTLIFGGDFSLAVLDTTAAVKVGALCHHLSPSAAAAFGRAFTLTAYLCSWLKEEGTLSVTVNGGGTCGKISVTGNAELCLCGYAEHADATGDIPACVGNAGTLTVVRSEPYCAPFVGTSELISGNLCDDFTRYFSVSEQRETLIAAYERFSEGGELLLSGGIVLQAMPFAGESSFALAKELIGKYRSGDCTFEGKSAEEIAREISPAGEISVREIRFRCHCSRERAEDAIRSLGKREAEEIVRQEGKINVHCHDCNTDYAFGEKEVAELFRGGE